MKVEIVPPQPEPPKWIYRIELTPYEALQLRDIAFKASRHFDNQNRPFLSPQERTVAVGLDELLSLRLSEPKL